MNVLFLTLLDFTTIDDRGIYTDLIREFTKNNHEVYIVSPTEKRKNEPTKLIDNGNAKILKLKIGNTQKTNAIEKGISILTLESKFKKGIIRYFANIKFDLVLYSTPPITLLKAVEYIKRRDHSKTYLLLKDIFPQNAVDLEMLKKDGIKGLLYKYFRKKEERLYRLSDYIGCMSEANVGYILRHNPGINQENVEVCPNSIELENIDKDAGIIARIRDEYNIPSDKTVFIYGGNLGRPQGIDFIIECLKANERNKETFFLIAGSGTEFNKLKKHFDFAKPRNARLLNQLPRNDYELLVNSCDVGLIFLDKRFTIPNFPSRMLSYMQASMPVLAATDINTDIRNVIEEGKFGYWCKSDDVEEFGTLVKQLCNPELRKQMGDNARRYLENHYTAKHTYEIIMKHFYKREEVKNV